jgi:hypothetical protein
VYNQIKCSNEKLDSNRAFQIQVSDLKFSFSNPGSRSDLEFSFSSPGLFEFRFETNPELRS